MYCNITDGHPFLLYRMVPCCTTIKELAVFLRYAGMRQATSWPPVFKIARWVNKSFALLGKRLMWFLSLGLCS